MNKADLIERVAKETNQTKAAAERAIDSIIKAVEESVANGDTVRLVGFGSFSVKERAARTAKNPQTGAEIKIPATKVPVFKAGKRLKAIAAGK